MITLLEGEFFGEDEIVNNNALNEAYGQRTYSAFVSSPKASVYVCPVQFFKKYIFERPNLLKKLREKYYIKKDLWETQFSNCLIQRKDIYYPENNPNEKDLKLMNVFSEKMTEKNRPKALETSNIFDRSKEQITIKKSVSDLKTRISEMIFKNELLKTNFKTNPKMNDSRYIESNDEKNTTINLGNSTNAKKKNTLEDHMQFINKKYEQLIKNKSPASEGFSFQSEKDSHLHSKLKVYLQGKFRRNFNKSNSETTYKNQSTKKFNDSLMKSIQCIKDRDKLDLNSFKMRFNTELNQKDSKINKLSLSVKNNKKLIYLNRIDLSNNSTI